jgi:membrane protein
VVVGAALAVVLWAISSVGFSIYLANFANYGLTYGSLGAAVGLLFYLCASVVRVGAEVNATICQSVTDRAEQTGKLASDDETTGIYRPPGTFPQGGEDG